RCYRQALEQEVKAARFLEAEYRNVLTSNQQIQVTRAERIGYADQLESYLLQVREGRILAGNNLVLQAQRQWADALATEYNFIAQYNTALAQFEFAKGTIQQHDNVVIAEGPLPQCARV